MNVIPLWGSLAAATEEAKPNTISAMPARPDTAVLDTVPAAHNGGWTQAVSGDADRMWAEIQEHASKHGQAMYELGRQHQIEIEQAKAEHEAELAEVYATRKVAINLPRGPLGEGYIYVVGFTTGYVKVGQTEYPKTRLATHRAEAAAFGVHVSGFWISPPHQNFRFNEAVLIDACKQVSARTRKEYFHTVGFEQAVSFASYLTYASTDLSATGLQWGLA